VSLPLLRPMLAVAASPFSDPAFLYEIKWDGYRCLAYLEEGTVLRSRNIKDLTAAFPELSRLHEQVQGLPALLDGEIVVLSDRGPDFAALQERGRLKKAGHITVAAAQLPVVYIAFDILYHRNTPVMTRPLTERKQILHEAVTPGRHLVVPDYVRGEGEAYFLAAAAAKLEGVMAKRLDSPYLPGRRSPLWRKIRAVKSADAVICGYEPGTGNRPLASLILGAYEGGRLVYIGRVGTGFSEAEAATLHCALEKLRTPAPPLAVPQGRLRRPHWVLPLLVCTVNYAAVTRDGCLRHPSFCGLRSDKSPEECLVPEAPSLLFAPKLEQTCQPAKIRHKSRY